MYALVLEVCCLFMGDHNLCRSFPWWFLWVPTEPPSMTHKAWVSVRRSFLSVNSVNLPFHVLCIWPTWKTCNEIEMMNLLVPEFFGTWIQMTCPLPHGDVFAGRSRSYRYRRTERQRSPPRRGAKKPATSRHVARATGGSGQEKMPTFPKIWTGSCLLVWMFSLFPGAGLGFT